MPERDDERTQRFQIEGALQLESLDRVPEDLALTAYVFDQVGALVGEGRVDAKGRYGLGLKLEQPQDVLLIIAPASDPEQARKSASYHRHFDAKEWHEEDRAYRITPDLFIPEPVWRPWWPLRICVSGRVRKVQTTDDGTSYCPVPYVKVEIFDVDREGCWWPYIIRVPELFPRPVIRIPELVKEIPEIPPRPWPPEVGPIGPIARLRRPGQSPGPRSKTDARLALRRAGLPDPDIAEINPQPEPPGKMIDLAADRACLGPQPEPPDRAGALRAIGGRSTRVGEMREVSDHIAAQLDQLTLTSRVAPWRLWRWCFYSTAEICQTYTDCDGYFRCCFNWWPWHFRRGRLRFDQRPDIIIKVTQVIDGVEKVIYLDPYTSTRWNATSTYVDLTLDDEDIVCGTGCGPETELGESQATLLQIGRDEVWKINQADGEYQVPGIDNGAYGGSLLLRGAFSADLKDGSVTRYYRLSYARAKANGDPPAASAFTPITRPLSVLRATPYGTFQTHLLGPHTIGSESGLFEVQDTAHWWITPWDSIPYLSVAGGSVLGVWPTRSFESGEGTYYLRMEMFDQVGAKMTGVDFIDHGGDGSGTDPTPPGVSSGQLDLKVKIDNALMDYDLVTPAPDTCGIIPWSAGMSLDFTVEASQTNGRVHRWSLNYVKGTVPVENALGSANFANGTSLVNTPVSGVPMLVDPSTPSGQLEKSCAFALILRAWSHVRVNYGWHYYGAKEYAVAIEKCPPCPPAT